MFLYLYSKIFKETHIFYWGYTMSMFFYNPVVTQFVIGRMKNLRLVSEYTYFSLL